MKFETFPDEMGFYGDYGGAFIPELLRPNVTELDTAFREQKDNPTFNQEYISLLEDYVGRPTPLYYSNKLSEYVRFKINAMSI